MNEESKVRVEDIDPADLVVDEAEWDKIGSAEEPGPVLVRINNAVQGAQTYKRGKSAGKTVQTCKLEMSIVARPGKKFENPATIWDNINLDPSMRGLTKFKNLVEKGCKLKVVRSMPYKEIIAALNGKHVFALLKNSDWKNDDGDTIENRELGFKFAPADSKDGFAAVA